MSEQVPAALRSEVRRRANDRCEYCLIHFDDVMLSHEADHIIAIKHGGQTESHNLAWACFLCNRFKGSDIASIDPNTEQLTPLFHPRRDKWGDHFRLNEGRINALTAIGRVTTNILRFNTVENIELRRMLQAAGRLP
ncbi:HNH endonuclease [Symmachiella dynata]|uniref:HNH endonuclease n=1 Tax=Symmachiella dynata TaxID=2527995 RepID=A0A517ZLR2_9PLAN|nr:HNH endonuclease signature motif containing protein [Symmachiella dynata]QDU43406.1 HNH endonuclease [Symmachiella dynata]